MTIRSSIAVVLIVAITAAALVRHEGRRPRAGGVHRAKVALIVVFIVAGLAFGQRRLVALRERARRHRRTCSRRDFAISLMYVSFAYSGWNAAAYIAGEVKTPEKTLPRSLLLGTGVVMALYVLLNVVYFYAVPSETLAGPPDKFAPVIEVGDAAARRAVRRPRRPPDHVADRARAGVGGERDGHGRPARLRGDGGRSRAAASSSAGYSQARCADGRGRRCRACSRSCS